MVRRTSLAILVRLLMPGCMIIQVGVTNPIPGLLTVGVAPFFNLSDERAVAGHQFASAYFSKLQKTPGFQVVPMGVTETAIADHNLQMNDPQDVFEQARILDVGAVVVGTVTDYSPY